jgi:hypothetical protein
MKAFINVIILSIVLISCHDIIIYAQYPIQTFDLAKLPKQSTVKLSDLGFADIEYIPLETSTQSLISGIDLVFFNEYSINKIISGDGYFIIKNGERVLKFKDNGSFIASIGKIGRGPNELNHIEDLDIDKENQNIYMVSGWQKKFCQYSPNGEFIKTFNVPFYVREFKFYEDKVLCYCGNNSGVNENSYILIDKQGNIINRFPNKYQFKSQKGIAVYTHENFFYGFNSKLFKKEIYSDTIYVFENNEFKPHMVITFGNKLVTPKVRSENNAERIYANYIQPLSLLEFGDYVYYGFIYRFIVEGEVIIYGFIGSKKDNHKSLFNLGEGIDNDLDGGPNIIPLTTKNDNTVVSLIDALTLKRHIASEEFKNSTPKYPEKKKELEKLANSLKETDNPVLVLVKLGK